jgi:secreted PhoX family phosphatase
MLSFENIMPSLKPGANTVVIASEDGSATDSQLYVYAGKKQSTGTAIDKAGLTNGDLHVMNIPTIKSDNLFRTTVGKNKKMPAEFVKVDWNTTTSAFAKESREKGTTMARVEDGHWDPSNPNVFYFLTTESNKDPIATAPNPATPTVTRDGGALWRLTFKDAQNPAAGAELEMLLNGGESLYLAKPDNLTVTENGKYLLLQEDPGNNAALARIIAYRVSDGKIAVVAQFDANKFVKGGSEFMTEDEESSGIIDVTKLLAKPGDTNSYFMFNAQVHTTGAVPARPDLPARTAAKKDAVNAATVEGGQFYVMTISNWDTVFNG